MSIEKTLVTLPVAHTQVIRGALDLTYDVYQEYLYFFATSPTVSFSSLYCFDTANSLFKKNEEQLAWRQNWKESAFILAVCEQPNRRKRRTLFLFSCCVLKIASAGCQRRPYPEISRLGGKHDGLSTSIQVHRAGDIVVISIAIKITKEEILAVCLNQEASLFVSDDCTHLFRRRLALG